MKNEDRAKSYSKQKHRLGILYIFITPLILTLLTATGLSVRIRYLTSSLTSNEYLNLLVFSIIIAAIYYILTLPLNYYSTFLLEKKFLLSNQTFKDWVVRHIKYLLVVSGVGLPFVLSLYIPLKYSPYYWWFFTWCIWFFLNIILTKIFPLAIVPIFYKYSPIENLSLKDRLIEIAKRAGFNPKGVYQIDISRDTKKANAALLGLGRQKRIVLCDTLLNNFKEEEIISVVAHELGHHRKQHTIKLILFEGLLSIFTFFMTYQILVFFLGLSSYAFESLVTIYLIMSIIGIFLLPIQNAFSRRLEREADRFALMTTQDKRSFVSMMRRLAEQNLSDVNPGRFYEIMLYTHPPISRRINFAESFKGIS